MTMSHILLQIFMILCVLTPTLAQEYERPYRVYATQQVHKRLLVENPGFADTLQAMETHIKDYGLSGEGRKDTISVLFHILYSPGQNYPAEAQIQAQIDALNRDFQFYEPPAESYALDKVQQLSNLAVTPDLHFCLAISDADGNAIQPIRYVETAVAEWGTKDSMKFETMGGSDAWKPEQFLNIWIAQLADNKAGYAQMPGGPSATDGIVLDYKYLAGVSEDSLMNQLYGQGKTLTHLVGSYLGLYELWNEIEPCKDDYVDDTPIHNAPNYFAGDIYYHISLCDTTYKTEMIMNFMDNSDDEVLNMITQGQKNRIKAVLSSNGARSGLASGTASCKVDEARSSEERNLEKRASDPKMQLYPNPAAQSVNLHLTSPRAGKVLCAAINSLGATVWNENLQVAGGSQSFRVDCSAWGTGAYIIKAVFTDGTVIAQKLILETP